MADPHHPIPTEIKKLRGNPGKRALNETEPTPPKVLQLPEPPDYLGEYGKREWNRVGPLLIKLGLLTEADFQVFEAYCLNVQLMVESRDAIEEEGLMVLGARGRVRNPAIAAFSAASTAVRGFAAEFGLTPSARSRIKLAPSDEDVLGNLMGGDDEPDDFTGGV